MQNSQRKTWVVLLVLFGIALLFFVYSRTPDKAAERKKIYREALTILDKSDRTDHYPEAVTKLEEALALVEPNSDREATIELDLIRAKENIGMENQDDQSHDSHDTYFEDLKQIALDENYSTSKRARALTYIGDFFVNHYDEHTAREIIFTGPLFQDLLKDDNILLGVAKIYELASDGGRDVASLRAADLYADELLTNATLTVAQKADYYSRVQKRLEMGEAYIERLDKRDVTLTSDELFDYARRVGYTKRLRANVLGKLFLLSSNQAGDDAEVVTDVYREALTILAQDKTFISKKMEMYTRLDYALWLINKYGAESGTEIDAVLEPIYDQDSNNKKAMQVTIGRAFEIEKERVHVNHYHRRGLLELAKAKTDFAEFLIKNYGWYQSDFETNLPPLLRYKP